MSSANDALLDEICSSDPKAVSLALQAAAPHRDTLAPVLLARLGQAAAEPDRWCGGSDPSPIFLTYLAAAWQLKDAHPLIVALLRLPPEQCDAMLGDFITEGAKLTLADTWPGDLGAIRALALDERAEPFARGAALNACALLVARNLLPRETALALLTECAALPLDPRDGDHANFAGQIVSTILDLRAWELRGTATALFARDLVDPFFCGDLDEVLAELEPGTPLAPHDSHRFPPPVTDAWEEVRHWHFFSPSYSTRSSREKPPRTPLPAPPAADRRETPFDLDPTPYRRDAPKVGRNDPCPCGSGKKYKKCCGA